MRTAAQSRRAAVRPRQTLRAPFYLIAVHSNKSKLSARLISRISRVAKRFFRDSDISRSRRGQRPGTPTTAPAGID